MTNETEELNQALKIEDALRRAVFTRSKLVSKPPYKLPIIISPADDDSILGAIGLGGLKGNRSLASVRASIADLSKQLDELMATPTLLELEEEAARKLRAEIDRMQSENMLSETAAKAVLDNL